MQESQERSYVAFISYRHRPLDREAAVALQKKIERFKVPKEFRELAGGDRLGYVFRDEDELPASSSLSDSIRYALDHTRYLIVICTPDLPKSRWCEEEIRYFLSKHDRDHALAVLVNGDPEESFSHLLTHIYDEDGNVIAETEPLAANIVGTPEHYSRKKFPKESTRICAALLGCPFDELWQRERRYQRMRRTIAGAAAFAGLSVFSGVVGYKNIQISRQNVQLQIREGELLVDKGELLLSRNERTQAAENARQALQIEAENPLIHTAGAQKLLADAEGTYAAEALRLDVRASQDTAVDRCAVAGDGETVRLYTSDSFGTVRAYDNERSLLWTAETVPPESRMEYLGGYGHTDLYLIPGEQKVLAGNAYTVCLLSAEDGSVLWRLDKAYATDLFAVSEDRTMAAVIGGTGRDEVTILSVEDGSEIMRMGLPAPQEGEQLYYSLETISLGRDMGGNFTPDGRYFLVAAGIAASDYEPNARDDRMVYCVFDLQEKTAFIAGSEPISVGLNPVFGLGYDSDRQRLFFARHDDLDAMTYCGVIDADGEVTYTMRSADVTMNTVTVPWSFHEGTDRIAVTSADNLYVLDRETCEFIGRYEIEENITAAWWADREEDVLFVLQEDGSWHLYPIGVLGQEGMTPLITNGSLGIDRIRNAFRVEEGLFTKDGETGDLRPGGGSILLLSDEDPGAVTDAAFHTDARVQPLFGDTAFSRNSRGILSADGHTFSVLEYGNDASLTQTELPADGAAEAYTKYDGGYMFVLPRNIGIYPDGRLQYGQMILTPEGDRLYLESTGEETDYAFYYHADVETLRDGTVLTAYACREEDGKDHLYLWKDGKGFCRFGISSGTVFASDTVSSSGTPGEDLVLRAGYVTVACLRKPGDPSYDAFLTVTPDGETHALEAAAGLRADSLVRPAAEKEIFAALEEDDTIRVYDAVSGEILHTVTDPSGQGGFAGVVDMAFAAQDRYLGILRYDGAFRLADLETGAVILSETVPDLQTQYGTTALTLDLTADGQHLLVTARETEYGTDGRAVLYDLTHLEQCAVLERVCGYSAKTDLVLLFRDRGTERRYLCCPIADAAGQ